MADPQDHDPSMTQPVIDPGIAALEALAAVEHEQWMAWASTIAMNEVISPERLARWEKAMVPYADLPENVKEQDREWARKALATPPVADLLRLAAIGRAVESFIDSLDPDDKTATFEFWRWQGPQWTVASFDRAGTGPTLDAAIAAATEAQR